MSGFFGFFDYNKPGKGVDKDEYIPRSRLFFDVLFRKAVKMVPLNLLYIIFTSPLIILFVLLSTAFIGEDNPFSTYLVIFEMFAFIYCSVTGFGFVMPGVVNIIRKFSHEKHAWIWSDFMDGVKKSFIQGVLLTVIDVVFTIVFFVALFVYSALVEEGFIFYCLRGVIITVYACWIMMHFYMYQIMVTFNLKLRYIIANAFMMTFAHLPRNIIIMTALLLLSWIIFLPPIIMSGILCVLIVPVLANYIVNFNTAPIIDMYMLEPLEDDEKENA